MMYELPSRGDKEYIEIESFQPYELTNCIAFEMAKRNSSVQQLIQQRKTLNDIGKKDFKKRTIIPKQIKNIDEELEEEYYFHEGIDIYDHLHLTNTSSLFSGNNTLYGKEQKNLISMNLLPTFKRPILRVPSDVSKEIPLTLNWALPIEDLLALVKYIKINYDNNPNHIVTAAEQLGEDLIKTDNQDFPKKPKAMKFADWFYIYDCYKILKRTTNESDTKIFAEIDLKLLSYYGSDKDDFISEPYYRQTIMKNMRYLIDELGYKELISGSISI